MKPPLSYYGGKQRLATTITQLMQAMPHSVYTEPFCGGAAVLFRKDRPMVTNTHHYREAINDKNNLISNFYRVAKTDPVGLELLINATLYSQADYKKAVQLCKLGKGSPVELAWAVFVNCNMSFACKMNGGWGVSVKSASRAATWLNRKLRLSEQLDRLSDVHIGCEDAMQFVDRWDSPSTLHYCDPPYVGTNCGHYRGYTQADFDLLINKLNNCLGSFILSGYSAAIVPDEWKAIEISITSSASGKGKTGQDRSDDSAKDFGDRSRVEKLWYLDRSKE